MIESSLPIINYPALCIRAGGPHGGGSMPRGSRSFPDVLNVLDHTRAPVAPAAPQEERDRKREEIQSLKREILMTTVCGRGMGRAAPLRRMLDRSLTGAKKLRAICRIVMAREEPLLFAFASHIGTAHLRTFVLFCIVCVCQPMRIVLASGAQKVLACTALDVCDVMCAQAMYKFSGLPFVRNVASLDDKIQVRRSRRDAPLDNVYACCFQRDRTKRTHRNTPHSR